MAASDIVQANVQGPRAAKDPTVQGLRAVADEIQRLSNVGLYSIPVRVSWNVNMGTKQGDFPNSYAHMTAPQLWQESINNAMMERKDAMQWGCDPDTAKRTLCHRRRRIQRG
jgi:hypothetical protein